MELDIRSLCVSIHVLEVGLITVSVIKVFKHFLLKETEKKGVTALQNINLRAGFSITGSSKFYLHIYINFNKNIWLLQLNYDKAGFLLLKKKLSESSKDSTIHTLTEALKFEWSIELLLGMLL